MRNFFRPAMSLVQVDQAAAQPAAPVWPPGRPAMLGPKVLFQNPLGLRRALPSTHAWTSSGPVPVTPSSSKKEKSTPVVTPSSGPESSTLLASTAPGSLWLIGLVEEELVSLPTVSDRDLPSLADRDLPPVADLTRSVSRLGRLICSPSRAIINQVSALASRRRLRPIIPCSANHRI